MLPHGILPVFTAAKVTRIIMENPPLIIIASKFIHHWMGNSISHSTKYSLPRRRLRGRNIIPIYRHKSINMPWLHWHYTPWRGIVAHASHMVRRGVAKLIP
jgi:hypothetical protein